MFKRIYYIFCNSDVTPTKGTISKYEKKETAVVTATTFDVNYSQNDNLFGSEEGKAYPHNGLPSERWHRAHRRATARFRTMLIAIHSGPDVGELFAANMKMGEMLLLPRWASPALNLQSEMPALPRLQGTTHAETHARGAEARTRRWTATAARRRRRRRTTGTWSRGYRKGSRPGTLRWPRAARGS